MICDENSFFSLIVLTPGEAEGRFALPGEPSHDKPLSLAGRAAAGALFLRYSGAEPPAPPRAAFGEQGKPYLPEHPAFHYNISHSGAYAAAAWSPLGEIGVDLQKISKCNRSVAARCFPPEDVRLLEQTPDGEKDAAFTRLWTEYEAVVKARGTGLLSLTGEAYSAARARLRLFHPEAPEGYALCVAVCV